MNFELKIRTAEGIVFSQRLAGPVTRFIAWFVDQVCIMVLVTGVSIMLGLLGFLVPGIATAVSILAYFAINIGYSIVLEWFWRGQTVGKRFLRLRVVDVDGMRLQFNQIVTRNLLRAVDGLPALYFVGGLACVLNRKCQRLGDLAANTIVIRTPRVIEPDLDEVLADKYNSLRQYPHLAARLRQRVSPDEASVALRALVRREYFDPPARIELFADLAGHFREKVEFPQEAMDGIGDEQYVRNVVDVVYRTGRALN